MAGRLRAIDFISARHRRHHAVLIRQAIEHRGAIDDPRGHQVDHALGAALNFAFDQHQPRRHHRRALFFHVARPQQRVDHAGFILDRDEHRIALAGALADQHDPGGAQLATIGRSIDVGTAQHAFGGQGGAQELHRMRLER